jgi:hypothetical protein
MRLRARGYSQANMAKRMTAEGESVREAQVPCQPTVCLSFDFDAMSAWMGGPDGVSLWDLARGKYGARVGMPRVLDLLQWEQLPATFFVPGHSAETFPELVKKMPAPFRPAVRSHRRSG